MNEEEIREMQEEAEEREKARQERGGATDEQLNQAYKELQNPKDPRREEKFLEERAKRKKAEEEGDDPNIAGTAGGLGFEVAAGVATDQATRFLLNPLLGPKGIALYGLANFASGAVANAIAQRMRGDTSFSLGEILASGAAGIIPGTTAKLGKKGSKIFGKANTIKRAGIAGGLTGVGSEQIRVGIDEKSPLTFNEAALAGAVGGTASASLQRIARGASNIANEYYQGLQDNNIIAYAASDDIISMAGFTKQREALNDYINRAYKHRFDRAYPGPYPLGNKPVQGAKTNLMKGFDETIKNDAGQEFILVRKRKLVNTNDVASKSNYELKRKFDVEQEIIARSGYEVGQDADVKFLQLIRRELNNIEQQNPQLYLTSLMEYGDSAYLEHKVARRMASKFWNRVEKQRGDGFGSWAGTTNRNTLTNLRLLFDPNYKTLKDTTETRLDKLVKKNNLPDNGEPEGFVVTIEDPNETQFSARSLFVRSNPGNIQIRKAGDGRVVGIIPDFYRQIYSTEFATAYKKNYAALAAPQVDVKIRARAGESIQQYRDRIINDMLKDAINNKGVLSEEDYLEDLAMFYGTFAGIFRQTGTRWVRIPQWAMDVMSTQTDIDRFTSPTVTPANIDVDTQKLIERLAELEETVRALPRTKTGRIERRFAKSVKPNLDEINEIRKKLNRPKFKL